MPASRQEPLNPIEMTALCCINVASLLSSRRFNPKYAALHHWEPCGNTVQCVFVCGCRPLLCKLVLVSCSPSLSLSISRMISLTRAPQGLVILVISSTRRSIVAASGRPNNAEKKKCYSHDPPPCSHHWRMTRSDQKAVHKQANEGCERFAEAVKIDENMLKNGGTKTCFIYIYIFASCVPQWISEWLTPVGETVLPGQINWWAFAHRPHKLMKRPRGYLQGHTKEVVQMLNEIGH